MWSVGDVSFALAGAQHPFPIVDQHHDIANFIALQRYGPSGGDYYDDDNQDYYDYDRPPRPPTGRNRRKPSPGSGGFQDLLKNQKQLGAILLGAGLLLTVMGMMLFFEGNLLRLGNIGIISGICLLIGPGRVSGFFLKESRMQATIITAIGILLVFWGKPKLGLLIEIFGLLNLFGNMFPMLLAIGKNIPVVGDVISSFDGSSRDSGGNSKNRYGGRGRGAGSGSRYAPDF